MTPGYEREREILKGKREKLAAEGLFGQLRPRRVRIGPDLDDGVLE